MKIKTLLALLLAAMPLCAQVSQPSVRYFAGAPSGACGVNTLAVNQSTGATYYCSSGTWAAITGGGGGSPGGSNTQVQYNNSGAFGGISGATTNGTNLFIAIPDCSAVVGGKPASGTCSLTISNAAYKTSNTTPVQVIAAQGAGTIVFLTNIVVSSQGAVVNCGSAQQQAFDWGPSDTPVDSDLSFGAASLVLPGVRTTLVLDNANQIVNGDTWSTSDVINQAVYFLSESSDPGNTCTNSLLLSVTYKIVSGVS